MNNVKYIHQFKQPSSFRKQFLALTKKEVKIQLRYPISILSMFLMNLFIIATFAIILKLFLDPTASSTTTANRLTISSISTFMFWGFLAFNIFNDSIYTIGQSMRYEQQTGTLETLFIYPVNHLANLLSKIFIGFILNVFVGIAGFFTIQALTGVIIISFPGVLVTLLVFLLLILQMYGFAFFIAGLSVTLKESILPLVNFLQFFIMIFSAFFTPFIVLGPFVIFSYVIPFSYTLDILRSTIFNSAPELSTILTTHGFIVFPAELQWLLLIIFSIGIPLMGFRYYIRAISKGRVNGDLTDY